MCLFTVRPRDPIGINFIRKLDTIEDVLKPLSTSSYVYEVQNEPYGCAGCTVMNVVVRRIGPMPV